MTRSPIQPWLALPATATRGPSRLYPLACRCPCECNSGPLCRWYHRCKQAPGWRLIQTTPGTFTWTAPSGRSYRTTATEYPG